jgi:DNA-binding IclR family transcriptional regulator
MWALGNSRERRAVLTALSEVGERGMTLCALGVAVDIPEAELKSVLERLVSAGVVRRQGQPWTDTTGLNAPIYHLARRAYPPVPRPRRHLGSTG